MNPKKATGSDKIPVKVVKLVAGIINSHLANIINNDLSDSAFSDSTKLASVRPIYKKDDRNKIKSYRPVSILNCFSKIYENFLNEQLLPFVNCSLSKFMSAYRSGYSTNHVLIQLIENWRHTLDNNLFTGVVLMDLLKAFDCISHDLLIPKIHAYGPYFGTVRFRQNNLKHRKKSVKINNISSFLRTILSGVPQGSMQGPILLNIFISDLFLWLTKSDLNSFTDGNTIAVTCKSLSDLLRAFKKNQNQRWIALGTIT